MNKDDFVTIMAGHFQQPIALLLDKLLEKPREGMPGIAANNLEIDWSISSILLIVTMFESWLARIRMDNPKLGQDDNLSAYYGALRTAEPSLPDLEEVFTLRNAIAHSHTWQVDFEWDDSGSGKLTGLHRKGTPKKAYLNCVDLSSGLTKTLGLHAVPTSIDRTDVSKVLDMVVEALTILMKTKLLIPQAFNHAVVLADSRRVTLPELAEHVRTIVRP